MTTRQIRRAAERKQRKLARKQQTQEPTATPTQNLNAVPSRPDAVTRADINRVNSQHSTGPRTPEGKVRSSRNSFKHGLYSQQLVMPGENPAELDALRADLRAEHRPANTTEEILVNEMAEHYWRLRRMRRYEVHAMSDEVNLDKWFNLLPLILRLMTSAERGFHKSLAELRRLQKGRDEAAHLSEP
ncbi:MAG: hypothetical protein JO336_12575, partial [Acidobacteriia bacterium]|nr:hypothetical protein [Terriglobia bacterium]